ncbi:phosphatase PAP2 family protein [Shewanella psychropiezotolerans]|uniref:undecaprenyl-diphosphate phosphatase n=1 Tax=Shewanella psychropiezotolerans TaxID=2593655 RepID=A0ABX5X4I2_9GAMM|nr:MULTISPECIES: phosphatase PAP2 family protein [Shewanella]MPY25777.1 phosphatase PAP2 family protein [Shewanella sp. YLB-07]QDO86265.1 phosphatase PAP2 family protein [Shewanella psychropiezotolerans]
MPGFKHINIQTNERAVDKTNGLTSGFFIIFCVLFFLHLLTLNQASNLGIFTSINDIGTRVPDWMSALLSDFGNGITLGAVFLCYLVKRPELICRVLLAALLSLIFVPLLKQYFDAPRPAVLLEYLNVIGEIRHKHSFPSGHSATAFLFAGLIYLSSQQAMIRVSLIFMASLVGVSRILVGAHWPADVVMGAIVGLSCAYIATQLCPLIRLSFRKRLMAYLLLVLALVSSELNTGYDFSDIYIVQYVRWGLLSLSTIAVLVFTMREVMTSVTAKRQRLHSH